MNIVEYIGENIEHFSFKYFGINDMFKIGRAHV